MGLGGGLLLVGHQVDDDRLAVGENLVVLRAVEIDDHARGRGIRAVARDAKALYVALVEQLGAQIAGRLGVGKIHDQAVGIADYLGAYGHGLAGFNDYSDAAGSAGDLHALERGEGFCGGRRGGVEQRGSPNHKHGDKR